jgi:hypothetical protein
LGSNPGGLDFRLNLTIADHYTTYVKMLLKFSNNTFLYVKDSIPVQFSEPLQS